MSLSCRQCGREFVFSKGEQEFYKKKGLNFPTRCLDCRSVKQSSPQHIVCSRCETALEKEASVYCTACLEGLRFESEQKTKESQKVASAAHTKLLAAESQKAELDELVRQKEKVIRELEQQVNSLGEDLEKAYQLHAGLQPLLEGIEKRLDAVEYAQNKTNERMLQLVERIHDLYDGASLWDVLKRSLGQYRREGA
jgi:chromosome segregation ATPase